MNDLRFEQLTSELRDLVMQWRTYRTFPYSGDSYEVAATKQSCYESLSDELESLLDKATKVDLSGTTNYK